MASDPHSIAALSLSFGLVAIPVKLFSATVPTERLAFHLLRRSDGSRVKQKYFAVKDGKPVERSDLVKGYEFAKDQFVQFTAQEIKALEDATTHAVDIVQFVPWDSVDPVYYSATYYLTPDRGGTKPYALLATALREGKQCAVGRWVSRGRENMVVIRPHEQGLALHQLHFQAEIRTMRQLGVEAGRVTDSELKLARQLIQQLSAKNFDPAAYHDEFRSRVEAAIQRKVRGKQISLADDSAPSKPGNVIDLMQALKASLGRSGATSKERKPPKRAQEADARKLARRR